MTRRWQRSRPASRSSWCIWVSGYEDRYTVLLDRLGPHRTGKACLYLKRLSDVDPDVLRTLVERSVRVARGVDR